MATPSRADELLNDAQLEREDAHGAVCDAMRCAHNAIVALRGTYEELQKVEAALRPFDTERPEVAPSPLFTALAALRELPAIRRASAWDGAERREVMA